MEVTSDFEEPEVPGSGGWETAASASAGEAAR